MRVDRHVGAGLLVVAGSLAASLALAQEGSPAFVPGAFQVATALTKNEEKIADAFVTGDGVGWHEHVHDVRHEVLEQTLIVSDRKDPEVRAFLADGVDAGGDLPQRVDVEAGIRLVEHRDVGFHQRHLQDLVPLLLTT